MTSTDSPLKKAFKKLYYILLAISWLWLFGLVIMQPLCAVPLVPALIVVMLLIRKNYRDELNHYIIPRYRDPSLWFWILVAAEFIFYLFMGAPTDAVWQRPWAKAPECTLKGTELHISNIRDFHYRTPHDFDIRYLSESFDLQTLREADFIIISSRRENKTSGLLSFGFEDGRHLVFSPETRVPAGSEVNLMTFLYKSLGRMYLFCTEEDTLAKYTEFGDSLSMLPIKATQPQMEQMLRRCVELATRVNTDNQVALPLPEHFYSGIDELLSIVCPSVKHHIPLSYDAMAHQLQLNGALQIEEGVGLERLVLSDKVNAAEPRGYSAALRHKIGLPTTSNIPARTVQEEYLKSRETRATTFINSSNNLDMISEFRSTQDIPEPRDRLSGKGQSDAIPELHSKLPPHRTDIPPLSRERANYAEKLTTAEQTAEVGLSEPPEADEQVHRQREHSQEDLQVGQKKSLRSMPDVIIPGKEISPLDEKNKVETSADNPFGDVPLSL